MMIEHFKGTDEVSGADDLRRTLFRREGGGVNEFWLSHGEDIPSMSILVKGDLATLHFFSEQGDAGLRSIGPRALLESNGMTRFCTESIRHNEPVPNRFVVPFVEALKAAEQFMFSKQLPENIQWMQL